MKNLRWKPRYLTGQADIDQQNRALVDCLNGFMNAAKQREHCEEIETLLEEMAITLEGLLAETPGAADIIAQIRGTMANALPLATRTTPGCRKCDICDLAEQKVAQHIHASAHCLGMDEKQ